MLSKNLYRMKKSPLATRRKNFTAVALIIVTIGLVIFSVYKFTSLKPTDGKKIEVAVATGDQPVKKNIDIYVNADGGLSLRESRDSDSKRLTLIPNGTKLTVSEELEGWYKVNYNNLDGWVSKKYTTTAVPPVDPTKDWKTFSSSGYAVKYQVGWTYQDYGKNDSLGYTSVVAFSNQTLPSTIPIGSDFVAPVIVNLSSKSSDEVNKTYAAMSGATVEALSVAGRAAQKYTFTSPTSNTQVSTVIVSISGGTLIFSEAGGYGDDLLKMLNTLTIG